MTTASDPTAPRSGVTECSPREADAWLREGKAVLIDVREPDEHARERINGACLVPLSSFSTQGVTTKAGASRRVVMQCRTGRRSADAARLAAPLATSGYEIVNLAGGIEAWKQAGLPVITDTSAPGISVMRQVQLTIGAGVLAGAVLAWFVHPGFVGLCAFFGAGLLFAGATGTCALASVIGMMPWNKGAACAKSCTTDSRG